MADKNAYLKYVQSIPRDWENQYGWYYYADAIRVRAVNTKTLPKIKEGKQSLVLYCESCNKQWQCNWINPTSKKRSINYYTDLPTYGMRRKICEKCRKKEEHFGIL